MLKVAYLGPQGSYSQLAAQRLCPEASAFPCASFQAALNAVLCGTAYAAVLPAENSLNGCVTQVIDLLQATDGVYASKSCILEIDHRLITLEGAGNITKIYSHRQALEQCAGYLAENYPEAKLIAVSSTSAGLEMLKDKTCACIAGAHAAPQGMCVSPCNIADERTNFTQFLMIVKGEIPQSAHGERVFFSATCRHEAGALLRLLAPLEKLNLTRIESRPIKDRPGEYRFFMEVSADYGAEETSAALEKVRAAANSLKILGCY